MAIKDLVRKGLSRSADSDDGDSSDGSIHSCAQRPSLFSRAIGQQEATLCHPSGGGIIGQKPPTERRQKLRKPKTVIIQARYIDQQELELFLLGVFGPGRCMVNWTRGHYQCSIPRGLKQTELEYLSETIGLERYEVV